MNLSKFSENTNFSLGLRAGSPLSSLYLYIFSISEPSIFSRSSEKLTRPILINGSVQGSFRQGLVTHVAGVTSPLRTETNIQSGCF